MKIPQTGSGAPTNRSRKADQNAEQNTAGQFKAHIQDEPASMAPGAGAVSPLTALDSLLTIQEAPLSTSDRQRALLQGDTLLDELAQLQIGLAQGWISEETLRRVTHLLDRPRPNLEDPNINQILDEIEVRAAVELAKLEDIGNPER